MTMMMAMGDGEDDNKDNDDNDDCVTSL